MGHPVKYQPCFKQEPNFTYFLQFGSHSKACKNAASSVFCSTFLDDNLFKIFFVLNVRCGMGVLLSTRSSITRTHLEWGFANRVGCKHNWSAIQRIDKAFSSKTAHKTAIWWWIPKITAWITHVYLSRQIPFDFQHQKWTYF